ncbi:MAG: LuxR family transcriptional regulator [Chloroflexi bacterium]|nr:MAG: LuxR family transcriptional regulator [Chloroflexota bacterium]
MTNFVLTTKLYIPPTQPTLVSRPHLIKKLNEGLHRKLTLISAPAGFGKTTLVSDWIANLQLDGKKRSQSGNRTSGNKNRIAWLSLDEGDNDLNRFLIYFIAAMQTVEPDIGLEPLTALQSSGAANSDAVLMAFLNEIASLSKPLILILDDYHVIENQSIDIALTFLLDHLPATLHLVITTRIDPSLPLARLRGRGQLTELRVADLRFTHDLATTFLNQMMRLELSAENIAALGSRTEGWITGLQLAALSLQERDADRVTSFIQSFTGIHHHILDYLVEEVLEQQPQETQTFLLQTAILDRLTGSLCEAVTGQENGQETLEMLERANIFIIPLDNERRWYRYHHLFAELLQQRLNTTHPNLIKDLHAKAVTWYDRNGELSHAIQHAFAGDDIEMAARLIEKGAYKALEQSDFQFVLNWVDRLPDNALNKHPWLFTYHSWALLLTGQVEVVGPRLENMDWLLDSFSNDDAQKMKMMGYIAGLKAIRSRWQRDYKNGLEFANQAIENLPENDWFRGYYAIMLGSSYWGSGNLSGSKDAFKESYLVGKASGSKMLAVSGGCNLAHTIELKGHLQQALELFHDLFQLAEQDGKAMPVAGYIHIDIARLFYELNQLDHASQHLADGIQLCKQSADGRAETIGYGLLARVQLAQGDIAEAVNMVQKAKDSNPSPDTPFYLRGGEYPDVWLWLREGNLKNLDMWLKESKVKLEGNSFNIKLTFSMYARVLITLGREFSNSTQINNAFVLLKELLELTENSEWEKKVVELLALQALAYDADGKADQAISTLERALKLAEPESFIRTFVDEGPQMARLLYAALEKDIVPNYVRKLLAAFPAAEPEKAAEKQPSESDSDWIETLSDRELEVLHLMAQDLSYKEIANQIMVSLNTVRTHIKNIYSKLMVNKRSQAIAKARELNLL